MNSTTKTLARFLVAMVVLALSTAAVQATPENTTLSSLAKTPSSFVGKEVRLNVKFHSWSNLALDYKPVFYSSKDHLSFVILQENSSIPNSEIKLVISKSAVDEQFASGLKTGTPIEISGKVISAALDEPWIAVTELRTSSGKATVNPEADLTKKQHDSYTKGGAVSTSTEVEKATQGKEKLVGIRSLLDKSDYQTAFTSMMEYLKADKQNLAAVSAQGLEQVTLGTPGTTTIFDLTTSALQTNIAGDTLRAHSLGRAAVNLLKFQSESPLNNFCKARLIAAMPDVVTSGGAIAAVDLTKPAEERDPNRPINDKWALIVGIGNFADKSIPKLKYPTKDAKDFCDFLINQANFAPDHIRLLLDEKATQRRVLTELGDKFLPRVARKDDLVVVYVSSHGSPSKVDVKEKNYLIAYDTEKSNLFASGIEMQALTQLIKSRVDSDRVLIVLDACHSGATDANAKDGGAPSNFDAEQIAQGCGQLVICSSDPSEKSWESKRYANGIFTRKLIEGLQKNGAQTKLEEAFDYVRDSVHDEVKEDEGVAQTPVLKSKWNGNKLVLTAKPNAPRPLPASVRDLLSPDSQKQDQAVNTKTPADTTAQPPSTATAPAATPATPTAQAASFTDLPSSNAIEAPVNSDGSVTKPAGGGLGKIINGLGTFLNNDSAGSPHSPYSTPGSNLVTDPQTGFLLDTYTGNLIDPSTGAVVGRKNTGFSSQPLKKNPILPNSFGSPGGFGFGGSGKQLDWTD